MTIVDRQPVPGREPPGKPHDPRRRARRRGIALAVSSVVLATMMAVILVPEQIVRAFTAEASAADPPKSPEDVIQELGAKRPIFGIYTPKAPMDRAALAAAEAAVGRSAGIIPYFADATHPLNVDLLDMAAADGAVPMISLETYGWSTSDIAAGAHDDEIANLADKLGRFNQGEGGTVLVRLNHEMNGHWYPWSEGKDGNPPGAYAASWQRIVDGVREQGTGQTTVLWVWSPNILRGAELDSMVAAYPGDAYVDYIGLTGYGATGYERSAAQTFDETINAIRSNVNADKPLIITESGASPGKYRTAWTRSLGPWLNAHPDVHAFVWFDADQSGGASNDWRFSAYPEVAEALRESLVEAGAR